MQRLQNIYSIRSVNEMKPTRKSKPICQQNCLSLLYNIAKHEIENQTKLVLKLKVKH